jgi:hypothetical protein
VAAMTTVMEVLVILRRIQPHTPAHGCSLFIIGYTPIYGA